MISYIPWGLLCSYPWHGVLMSFCLLRPGFLTRKLRVRRQHFIINVLPKRMLCWILNDIFLNDIFLHLIVEIQCMSFLETMILLLCLHPLEYPPVKRKLEFYACIALNCDPILPDTIYICDQLLILHWYHCLNL